MAKLDNFSIVFPYLFFFLIFSMPADAWYNNSYGFMAPFIVNSTSDTVLQNYPARLVVDTEALISKNKMQADCDDLLIVNSSNDTPLAMEIENSTCNTPTTILYFKIPQFNTGNQTFYLYYNSTLAQINQSPKDVWTENFTYVFHMNDTLLKSSTPATPVFNIARANNVLNETPGKFGNATRNPGATLQGWNSSDRLVDWLDNVFNWTVSAWVLPNSTCLDPTPAGYLRAIFSGGGASGVYADYAISLNSTRIIVWSGGPTGLDDARNDYPFAYTSNQWAYVAGGWNGTKTRAFLDGVELLSSTNLNPENPSSPIGGTYRAHVAGWQEHNTNEFGFNCTIDEIRVSNGSRTTDWLKAEYGQLNFTGEEEPQFIAVNQSLPANDSDNFSSSANFGYYANFSDSIVNASIFTNITGSWSLLASNASAIGNNTLNWINSTLPSLGLFAWNVQACYKNGWCNFSNANFTHRLVQFRPSITGPSGSYISGAAITLAFTPLGDFLKYAASYSLDGAANVSLGTVNNNTEKTASLGTPGDGAHSVIVYLENATFVNSSSSTFSLVATGGSPGGGGGGYYIINNTQPQAITGPSSATQSFDNFTAAVNAFFIGFRLESCHTIGQKNICLDDLNPKVPNIIFVLIVLLVLAYVDWSYSYIRRAGISVPEKTLQPLGAVSLVFAYLLIIGYIQNLVETFAGGFV
jgi:hypothetical protein